MDAKGRDRKDKEGRKVDYGDNINPCVYETSVQKMLKQREFKIEQGISVIAGEISRNIGRIITSITMQYKQGSHFEYLFKIIKEGNGKIYNSPSLKKQNSNNNKTYIYLK